MRRVDFYLENIDNIIETNDISTMSNSLTILTQYIYYLTPLFNECLLKSIDVCELCPELNDEHNATIMAISKLTNKLNELSA